MYSGLIDKSLKKTSTHDILLLVRILSHFLPFFTHLKRGASYATQGKDRDGSGNDSNPFH
jgi:hypothetical protein